MWWHTFLGHWNGKAMMHDKDQWTPAVEVYTYAAEEIGCGAWWGVHWLQLKWARAATRRGIPITQKEVLPAVLACGVANGRPKGQLYCDNEATVAVLNAGYSHDPLIMHLLRSLFFVKAYFDLDLRVFHIPSKENVIADAISCDYLTTLCSQVPSI